MNKKYYSFLEANEIKLLLISDLENLLQIHFYDDSLSYLHSENYEKETTPIISAKNQLIEYFNKKRETFELPHLLMGTAFQLKVWKSLMEIPYGKTVSYHQLAEIAQTHHRPLSANLSKNPLPIIYPCHRVLGKNNQLTGFSGSKSQSSLSLKQHLLNIEK